MITQKLFYGIYQNQINPFLYIYDEKEILLKCRWIVNKENFFSESIKHKKWVLFENELDRYFKKELSDFNIKLFDYYFDFPFTSNVLKEMKNITFGKIKSYKEIALNLNNPKAARVVGSICRKNRYPLIIPCHRVVGKNDIGGYVGKKNQSVELSIKKKLLQFEGLILIDAKY